MKNNSENVDLKNKIALRSSSMPSDFEVKQMIRNWGKDEPPPHEVAIILHKLQNDTKSILGFKGFGKRDRLRLRLALKVRLPISNGTPTGFLPKRNGLKTLTKHHSSIVFTGGLLPQMKSPAWCAGALGAPTPGTPARPFAATSPMAYAAATSGFGVLETDKAI